MEDCLDLLDYKIPAEIKSKIPEYFYYAFGGEYVSIYGKNALIKDEDGLTALDYDFSTSGYAEALKATCKKLDMDWLFDYWKSLPWYHSDIFDDEIAGEVLKRFEKNESANAYYKYLLDQNE